MIDKITKLHVVEPPLVPARTKANLIALLEEVLEEAKSGEISEALIIVQRNNVEQWGVRSAHLSSLTRWIGMLAIVEDSLIAQHKEQDNG